MTRLTAASALAMLWATGAMAQTELTMWYHGAGNQVESEIVNRIIADFNASQSDWVVSIESFPQNAYNDAVVAAALAGDLPDILDVDGPIMPNWAWAGYLQPLPIEPTRIEAFLPGTKGVWNDQLYSVGLWDAAVALITRQSTLDALGLRTPTLEEPWTQEEFMGAMEAAKASGDYEYAIDLGMSDQSEWYPYAFLPFLWSFGGDLIDAESGYQTAEGVLNGEAALAFGEWWQGMFTEGYAPGPSQDPADHASGFQEGQYAFTWNGNWLALPFLEAFDDVVFLPAPDFGNGNFIGAASWQFAVSGTTEHPEGGAAFIEFALKDEYLRDFSNGIGLIPPTPTAAAMTENYAEGGPMAVFYDLSEDQARLRPVFPGYPVAAKVFAKALTDIANGADVADSLDTAVDEIEADVQSNQGYGQQ
ncbi:extracellular solute-binding protein [Rubellimicrobium rubrum]|uniref:Extracellular solute-binding protein n=1 Tax=Rubellimicrobium rubrum TaxID=2585369 RepID=A0A5C4MMX3_9RHOB|nr:extracellular solute-binding protein [Rubellimicrobium rubrum]TNC46926.1 extracellular solute-binding protein [Rubellimicrobium rubrum]